MSFRDQIEKMSPREQKLLLLLGVIFGAGLLIGGPAYIYLDLAEAREHSDNIRSALKRMEISSELLALRRQQREALALRYATPTPPLDSFIDEHARKQGLKVPESTVKRDVPTPEAGYTERYALVKLRKINLKPLTLMLEGIKNSGHPVSISRLRITKRATAPDLWDVTLAVSAFDKKDASSKKAKSKGKGKGKGKSKTRTKSKSKSKSKGQPL